MSKISMDKKYQTRDGREVRVLCIDSENKCFPVVAIVGNGGNPESYTSEGNYFSSGGGYHFDLLEIKPKEKYLKTMKQLLEQYPDAYFDDHGDLIFENSGRCIPTEKFKYLGMCLHTCLGETKWVFPPHNDWIEEREEG